MGITADATATLYIETPSSYDQVKINLKAESKCADIDHIAYDDLENITSAVELKANKSLSSDATVNLLSLTLSAKDEIILQEGFEILGGSELNIRAEDRCSSNN